MKISFKSLNKCRVENIKRREAESLEKLELEIFQEIIISRKCFIIYFQSLSNFHRDKHFGELKEQISVNIYIMTYGQCFLYIFDAISLQSIHMIIPS